MSCDHLCYSVLAIKWDRIPRLSSLLYPTWSIFITSGNAGKFLFVGFFLFTVTSLQYLAGLSNCLLGQGEGSLSDIHDPLKVDAPPPNPIASSVLSSILTLPPTTVPATKTPLRLNFTAHPLYPRTSRILCGDLDTNFDLVERYCQTENIALDVLKLPGFIPFGKEHVERRPNEATVLARCGLNETQWFGGRMVGKGAAGWVFDGMEIDGDSEKVVECAAWIETPLFFISRWDTTNPYQSHQDFINTFRVYSALGLSVRDFQPVFLDARLPDGPYTSLWATLFSSSKRLLDLNHIAGIAPGGGRVCVRRAVWGVHGGVSPIARNGKEREACFNAPILEAFRSFVVDRLRETVGGEEEKTRAREVLKSGDLDGDNENALLESAKRVLEQDVVNADRGKRAIESLIPEELGYPEEYQDGIPLTLRVTYAIRDATTAPDPISDSFLMKGVVDGIEGFQDVTSSFSKMTNTTQALLMARGYAPPPQEKKTLSRPLENQEDLIEALRIFISNWSPHQTTANTATPARSLPYRTHFRAVDFATLPIESQISIAQDTDLFIGPHGAVFVHLFYLRREPNAAVVELQPPERASGNYQFENMARRMGYNYTRVGIGRKVEKMQEVLEAVEGGLMGIIGEREGMRNNV
ncbi:hypothetical protein HDU67_004822 [Dinochytrium kinnereticum]|nr:hypothetical protein HDU67_004822 [Dinochytrium kinnereticum]